MSTTENTQATSKFKLFSTPLPQATDTYSPVPHKIVIETIGEALDKANLKLISESYTYAKDGRQANGFYQINSGDGEMSIRLQFQNSYDKSIPLAAALGGHVIVCRNGVVQGDMGAFKRKHTGTVLTEFQSQIGMYIDKAGDLFEDLRKQRERMKEIEVTKKVCGQLIGDLFVNENIITATQLGIIAREIQAPSFDYGTTGTLWNAYNAVTVGLKESHPRDNMNRHVNLHKFIQKEFSLA